MKSGTALSGNGQGRERRGEPQCDQRCSREPSCLRERAIEASPIASSTAIQTQASTHDLRADSLTRLVGILSATSSAVSKRVT